MKPSAQLFYRNPVPWIMFSAILVRLLPEILSFPHPIGFDTVFYGWKIGTGVIWTSSSSLFSTWLFYGLAISLRNLLQIDPFMLLKVLAPVLYGVNAVGMYYFARRALSWSPKYASLVAFVFMFHLASLRLSWDLYRNMLGLGALLFALSWLPRAETWKGSFVFALLSVLVAFSHEYAAVTLIFIIGGLLAKRIVRREMRSCLKTCVAFLLCLILFLGKIALTYIPSPAVETNLIEVNDVIYPGAGKPCLFVNYLDTSYLVSYSSYLHLFADVSWLFLVLYAFLLPLVLAGLFRNLILNLWALFLSVGAFGALVSPSFALNFWDRLMFMLIYPFTFYAVNGIKRVYESDAGVHLGLGVLGRFHLTKTRVRVLFLILVSLGAFYVAVPHYLLNIGSSRAFSVPIGSVHFPATFFANTILVEDVNDLERALVWLRTRLADSSVQSTCVIVQDAFLRWTQLYLGDQCFLLHFFRYADYAVHVAVQQGFSVVYFVWWTGESNLYEISMPSFFVSVFGAERFSVYEYHHVA